MAKKNSSIKNNLTVEFQGSEIQMVKHHDEPFVVVKQVVEGVGLDWKTQYRKLNASRDRFSLDKITIETPEGPRTAVGMPLRKLPGWLMSIQPNKVRAELRSVIIKYQTDCDEVLWKHWNGSTVVPLNHSAAPTPPPALPDNTLRHVWMTLDAAGQVKSQHDMPDLKAVATHVEHLYPKYVVVNRAAMIEGLDKVNHQMLVAQNEVRQLLNPVIVALGTSATKSKDQFMTERYQETADRFSKIAKAHHERRVKS